MACHQKHLSTGIFENKLDKNKKQSAAIIETHQKFLQRGIQFT